MSLAKQNAFRSSPAHRRAFAFLEHGVWALFHASRSFLRGRRGPYYERRLWMRHATAGNPKNCSIGTSVDDYNQKKAQFPLRVVSKFDLGRRQDRRR
jgi:hypothetical protein